MSEQDDFSIVSEPEARPYSCYSFKPLRSSDLEKDGRLPKSNSSSRNPLADSRRTTTISKGTCA